MLVSPTEDTTKILAAFARLRIGGCSNFVTSIQIAKLALQHRKNKAGGQRIVAFVGSPITEHVDDLKKVGKLLKKNNVAVDIISIGEVDSNNDKLSQFIDAVSSTVDNRPNSNFIIVPTGVSPQDAILSSPVMHAQGNYGGGVSGGGMGMGGDAGGLGFDEAMDPDLAMALRVTAEEARARVQASMEDDGSSSFGVAIDEDDEEALMQRALAMSIADAQPPATAAAGPTSEVAESVPFSAGEDDDEDDALRMALELSMAGSAPLDTAAPLQPSATAAAAATIDFPDPAALSAMLAEVTGRDASDDPLIQAALEQMRQDALEKDKSKKRKDNE